MTGDRPATVIGVLDDERQVSVAEHEEHCSDPKRSELMLQDLTVGSGEPELELTPPVPS
jgi:hypothetical protein